MNNIWTNTIVGIGTARVIRVGNIRHKGLVVLDVSDNSSRVVWAVTTDGFSGIPKTDALRLYSLGTCFDFIGLADRAIHLARIFVLRVRKSCRNPCFLHDHLSRN